LLSRQFPAEGTAKMFFQLREITEVQRGQGRKKTGTIHGYGQEKDQGVGSKGLEEIIPRKSRQKRSKEPILKGGSKTQLVKTEKEHDIARNGGNPRTGGVRIS